MRLFRLTCVIVLGLLGIMSAQQANAQSFGIELHNTLMPASGGMAGVSLARPQDLQSAINGNPATLTQFRGTQFSFGGGWAEATYRVTQLAPLPALGVTPYSAKSGTPGAAVGNIGVTQDFTALGMPVTAGIGFITNAGAGVDFREVPESSGTSAHYMALDIPVAIGVKLTDRFSAGAALTLGSSFLDGPFVDIGGMTPAFALRGTVGFTYDLGSDTTVGMYWQTMKSYHFEDAVVFADGTVDDVDFQHPENFGLGIANNCLMDGRLLLAMDVLYKQHSKADFLRAIYRDQWVYQFGAQYEVNRRLRVRLGYAYNENPMRSPVPSSVGGVPMPDGVPGVRYVQGQFAAISQHRMTGGVGLRDLLPGLDFDIFAGGMFENTDQLAATVVSVQSYWVGAGLTWRFGRGASDCQHIASQW